MQDEQFCGTTGGRTIFTIKATLGYAIEEFSAHGPEEQEVLLRPLTKLRVRGATRLCHPRGDGRKNAPYGFPDIVMVDQIPSPFPAGRSVLVCALFLPRYGAIRWWIGMHCT
jgi:hypothetical protein